MVLSLMGIWLVEEGPHDVSFPCAACKKSLPLAQPQKRGVFSCVRWTTSSIFQPNLESGLSKEEMVLAKASKEGYALGKEVQNFTNEGVAAPKK